jgi:hypothetical protein
VVSGAYRKTRGVEIVKKRYGGASLSMKIGNTRSPWRYVALFPSHARQTLA